MDEFTELSYRAPGAPEAVYRYHETTLVIDRQKRPAPLEVRALFVHSSRREIDDAEGRLKQLDKALARLAYIDSKLNARRYAKFDYAREQVYKAVPARFRDVISTELSGADRELTLSWSVDESAFAELGKLDGRYIVIADVDDLAPDEIFALFKRQNVIEQRFRAVKSDLKVQPLWLHKEVRIRALLLVFVLALLVYTLIELQSERAGLSTKRYHRMTARELIRAFAVVDLIEVRVRGAPTEWQLQISEKQTRLLQRLRLPAPNNYLITD
jgi:transposase